MSKTWMVTSGQTLETTTDMRLVTEKIAEESHPWKRGMTVGMAESESDQAEESNWTFTDVFTQSMFNEAPLFDRSATRMNDITV